MAASVMRSVLQQHEIASITTSPTPNGGWWVAVAICKCGHSDPPEHRESHLRAELIEAGLRDA